MYDEIIWIWEILLETNNYSKRKRIYQARIAVVVVVVVVKYNCKKKKRKLERTLRAIGSSPAGLADADVGGRAVAAVAAGGRAGAVGGDGGAADGRRVLTQAAGEARPALAATVAHAAAAVATRTGAVVAAALRLARRTLVRFGRRDRRGRCGGRWFDVVHNLRSWMTIRFQRSVPQSLISSMTWRFWLVQPWKIWWKLKCIFYSWWSNGHFAHESPCFKIQRFCFREKKLWTIGFQHDRWGIDVHWTKIQ